MKAALSRRFRRQKCLLGSRADCGEKEARCLQQTASEKKLPKRGQIRTCPASALCALF
jgi:hypothetical protein